MKDFQSIFSKIAQKRIPSYFISPHLDDAVLEAGGLLRDLAKMTQVTVVTVFTETSKRPMTLSAKTFMKQCGYDDERKLFLDRRAEDMIVLDSIGARHVHLDFVDASWRKKSIQRWPKKALGKLLPEVLHIYPTYRWHVVAGKISQEDDQLARAIKEKLRSIVGKEKQALVFCPLGVGGHVDHVLTRNICLDMFDDWLLWLDSHYADYPRLKIPLKDELGLQGFNWTKGLQKKKELVLGYKTQVGAMFPDGAIPLAAEQYFTQDRTAKKIMQ